MKMRERFLLDRIDAEARRAAVRRQHHRVTLALAHEAQTALTFRERAVARTDVALDAPAVRRVPVLRGVIHRSGFALRDGVTLELDLRRPEIRRQSRLALQLREERLGRLQLLPHLRKERASMAAAREEDAIRAHAKRRARARFGAVV